MHALVCRQEIAVSSLLNEPLGLGLSWIDQADPFQRSINVAVINVPEASGLSYDPTAVHALAVAHDTPSRTAAVVPVGRGTGCADQLEPFQL
jgi:hypothetical protein